MSDAANAEAEASRPRRPRNASTESEATGYAKRKRTGSEGSVPENEPTTTSKANAKRKTPTGVPRRAKAKKARDATTSDAPGADMPQRPVPTVRPTEAWPEWFQALEKTHRALNLVYTFCCTRKHLLTTFDTMKTAVEANTGRPLSETDVAALAAVLHAYYGASTSQAGTLRFEYVDERSLQVDIQGSERDQMFRSGTGWFAQEPAADASVGGITGRETFGEDRPSRQVLYFEFVDEGLKRQAEPKSGNSRLRNEKLRMPVYGQEQMAGLIDKRNRRLAMAVNAYLDACEADGRRDPADALRAAAVAFVPVEPPPEPLPLNASSTPTEIPSERQTIAAIIDELRQSAWYTGQIVPRGHRVFAAQAAVYGDLDFLLSQDVVNALYNGKGITRLFAHQAEALNALHAGRHVVVATATSSGKSLVFQVPVVRALEADAGARALYIFPTKALAQDQTRSLRELLAFMPTLQDAVVATFDGDTPWAERDAIRATASVVVTNPDMLHASILPGERRWRSFLQRLAFVVVDELHYYNGLLGTHVAFVLRRLRRLCAALGNWGVQFVSCSATVGDPRAHAAALFGEMPWERGGQICVVDVDGSPSARKDFLVWNTPFRVPGDASSGRGSGLVEVARLFCELVLRGVRVIAFCRVREQCEKLTGAVQAELTRRDQAAAAARVVGYRGGFTPQDRRRIEADMFAGRLLGIVATSALELGVDIGALDCVITWGFPSSMANLRQQSGRAGRRAGRDALAVLVGDAFATDQHYMQNPDLLFDGDKTELVIDLANDLVREAHVQCAAAELPVRPADDEVYFGPGLQRLCEARLTAGDDGVFHCHARFRPQPARYVALRDAEDEQFAVVDIGHDPPVVLEEMEASRASFTLYDGAIYMHQGRTFLVRDFCPARGIARVERVAVDWTTTQRDYTDVDAIETYGVRTLTLTKSDVTTRAYLGRIRIAHHVFGYFKVDKRDRILDAVHVDNPPVVRYAPGVWLDVPAAALSVLERRRMHAAAAIHAAEHAVLALLPSVVASMPGDVRTECKSPLKEFQNRPVTRRTHRTRPARLVFYDAKGGSAGCGLTARAIDYLDGPDGLLHRALTRIESCVCAFGQGTESTRGCPECTVSLACREANSVMSKAGARVVLRSLLHLPIDEDRLPMGPEEGIPEGPETVVVAVPVPGVQPTDQSSIVHTQT